MAQQAVEKVGADKHNFARTGRMALYGGCTHSSPSSPSFRPVMQLADYSAND